MRVFAWQPGARQAAAMCSGWHCAFGFPRTPIITVSRGDAIASSFHLRFSVPVFIVHGVIYKAKIT